jgi:ATP-dependent DNA helicase RecG
MLNKHEPTIWFTHPSVWWDWLTAAVMDKLGLSERQKKAVAFLKTNERITNTDFQKAFQVAKRTAYRDLNEMVSKGALEKVGSTGRGTFYILSKGAK